MNTAQRAVSPSNDAVPILLLIEGNPVKIHLPDRCSGWHLSKMQEDRYALDPLNQKAVHQPGASRKKIYEDVLSSPPASVFVRVRAEKDKVPAGLIESLLDFHNRNVHPYVFFDGRMIGLRDLFVEVSDVAFALKVLTNPHPFLPSGQLNFEDSRAISAYTPTLSEFRLLRESNFEAFNAPPSFLAVEVTPRCNLRCRMCPNHGDNPLFNVRREEETDISVSSFRGLIKQASEMGVKNLSLSLRGEPFLHPDILDLIESATTMGFRVGTTTNGTLLKPESLKRLHGAGLKGVTISIDSLNEAVLERLRVGVNTQNLLRNIFSTLEFKHSLSEGEFLVGINCVVEDDAEEEKMVSKFLPSMDSVGFGKRLLPETGKFEGRFLHPGKVRRFPCRFPYTVMMVKSDGHAVKCGMSVLEKEDAGDVHSSSLAGVWRGDFYTSVREAHLQGAWNLIPSCRRCEQWLAWIVVEERRDDVLIRTSPLTREYSKVKSNE